MVSLKPVKESRMQLIKHTHGTIEAKDQSKKIGSYKFL